MNIQKLYGYTRKAINDYDMISEGDRIAVGVSGGKDSLTLLNAMVGLQKFYPVRYEIMAITCDVGFEGSDYSEIQKYCDEIGVHYEIVRTQIADIVFNHHKDERPCSLCATLRKGAMYQRLEELGFNKIAYAHNKDDFIETALMTLLYEGRFYSFPPKTELPEKGITVIRPLMYVPEKSVEHYAIENSLPVAKSKCPVDGETSRAYAKNLIADIVRTCPEAKNRIMHAIESAGFDDWPKKKC